MPRYIDANALISDSRICGNCKDYEICDGNIAFCPNASARRAINEAPTVDVELVKHGRWYANNIGDAVCSNCKCIQDKNEVVFMPYCPKCGCRQDL